MARFSPRTDLALESKRLASADTGELEGVKAEEFVHNGFPVTRVSIVNQAGSDKLCKPIGDYYTLELDKLIRREENSFSDCVSALGGIIGRLLGKVSNILVIGLGNAAITPDAIGPWAIDNVLVTRHLKDLPEFARFSSVSALRPGVLGTTGLEAAKITKLVAGEVKPDAVIVIDALASAEPERLCRTVQITDTGIVPGSGVGNARAELSKNTLGMPVIAIGVPTVTDAAVPGMIVTPRDIDRSARDAAKLVGYGINLALHEGLTVEDIDMLIG